MAPVAGCLPPGWGWARPGEPGFLQPSDVGPDVTQLSWRESHDPPDLLDRGGYSYSRKCMKDLIAASRMFRNLAHCRVLFLDHSGRRAPTAHRFAPLPLDGKTMRMAATLTRLLGEG